MQCVTGSSSYFLVKKYFEILSQVSYFSRCNTGTRFYSPENNCEVPRFFFFFLILVESNKLPVSRALVRRFAANRCQQPENALYFFFSDDPELSFSAYSYTSWR